MRLTWASWALGIAGATLLLGLAIVSVNKIYLPPNEPQAQRVRAPVPRPTRSSKLRNRHIRRRHQSRCVR